MGGGAFAVQDFASIFEFKVVNDFLPPSVQVQHQHMRYTNVLLDDSGSTRKPTAAELHLVLDSLLASHAMLMEDGLASARKAPGDRRVLLNIESTEVERVLVDLGGQRWKSALGL